jgi:general stress protein YciG
MADNSGQFEENNERTERMASEGGKASPAKFGSEQGADPSEAGREGGQQ